MALVKDTLCTTLLIICAACILSARAIIAVLLLFTFTATAPHPLLSSGQAWYRWPAYSVSTTVEPGAPTKAVRDGTHLSQRESESLAHGMWTEIQDRLHPSCS